MPVLGLPSVEAVLDPAADLLGGLDRLLHAGEAPLGLLQADRRDLRAEPDRRDEARARRDADRRGRRAGAAVDLVELGVLQRNEGLAVQGQLAGCLAHGYCLSSNWLVGC